MTLTDGELIFVDTGGGGGRLVGKLHKFVILICVSGQKLQTGTRAELQQTTGQNQLSFLHVSKCIIPY